MKRLWMIITGLVLVVAVVGGCVFYAVASRQIPTGAEIKPLPKDTIDAAAFKDFYPLEYESYLKNAQNLPVALKYHAAEPKNSRLATNDWMKVLWNGYAFSKEYNEARGHAYVIEDLIGSTATARINDKTNLTCMYCKTAEVPGLLEKMGNSFFNTKLLADNNKSLFQHPLSCSDCHNPETMELRITRPAFTEAMARRGVDVSKASKQDMRTYVCAQCHVTYFFNPNDNNRVWFPWDKGFDAKDMYEFETNDVKLTEWTHPQTGEGMIKARHPEFEFWQGSTHQQNGVSCADCHMPYVKEGDAKITSHW
jgi:nitrite reductase (cytochrome c-552)